MPTASQLSIIKSLSDQYLSTHMLTTNQNESIDELLKSFIFVFHDNLKLLESSLDILDKNMITEIKCDTSGRRYWKVPSSQGSEYLCLAKYCPCKSYFEKFRHHQFQNENEIVVSKVL